ncbi:MAG: type II toxin-antitoxin system HicA family toxin [Methanothrix sp.]|nr:MAG: type II toxin-antitoxin system HicA family toxin [Methanothrix sp.]
MSSQKFVKLLCQGGARFVRQSGTSHAIFKRENDRNV